MFLAEDRSQIVINYLGNIPLKKKKSFKRNFVRSERLKRVKFGHFAKFGHFHHTALLVDEPD